MAGPRNSPVPVSSGSSTLSYSVSSPEEEEWAEIEDLERVRREGGVGDGARDLALRWAGVGALMGS